jgi:hypothetical protein
VSSPPRAALTIYAAALGLAAIALAALLHRGRRAFFGSPAPYVATLVFAAPISPHLVWLVTHDFAPLHWAALQLDMGTMLKDRWRMPGHQIGLLAIPIAGAALALLSWRTRRPADRPAPTPDRFLVLVVAAVLMLVPPLVSFPLNVKLKNEWATRSISLSRSPCLRSYRGSRCNAAPSPAWRRQPEFSPWIDYPGDLRRNGFVGIGNDGDTGCLANLSRLDPGAEKLDVTLARERAGMRARLWTFNIRIAQPR